MRVYRTIGPLVLSFDPKHRLWVLVRTALARWFQHVPTINVLSKSIKNIIFFPIKFSMFTAEKITVYCMDKFSLCHINIFP